MPLGDHKPRWTNLANIRRTLSQAGAPSRKWCGRALLEKRQSLAQGWPRNRIGTVRGPRRRTRILRQMKVILEVLILTDQNRGETRVACAQCLDQGTRKRGLSRRCAPTDPDNQGGATTRASPGFTNFPTYRWRRRQQAIGFRHSSLRTRAQGVAAPTPIPQRGTGRHPVLDECRRGRRTTRDRVPRDRPAGLSGFHRRW